MRRLISLLILLSAGICFSNEESVVIAIDTSRSLSKADLTGISEALCRDIRSFPAETPVGVIAFDDTARWIAEPTLDRESLFEDMKQLEPGGRYTVLNDALFLATGRLEQGGVIVLVSDGRDENSAVEVRDIQTLCRENHVAILAMSGGNRRDERALRRLSMLSGGRFLGELDTVEPGDLAGSIVRIFSSLEQLEPTPLPHPEKDRHTGETLPKPTPAPARRHLLPTWVFPLGILVIAIGLALWILLRQKGPSPEICQQCGSSLEDGACPTCEFEAVEEAARTNRVAASAIPGPASLDPEALARDTLPGNIERTMTLGEVAVLTVREEGAPERSYSLPRDRIFAVGRAPGVNTLVMEDPTISSQHFKIVFREGLYYVVDLGTTNGTLVNSEKVRVRRLAPGDTIRAGLTDFVFSFYGEALP